MKISTSILLEGWSMLKRILLVVENSLFEMHKKRAFLMLGLLLVLTFLAPLFIKQKYMMYGMREYSMETAYHESIISLLKFYYFIGLVITVLFASRAVESEISRRTVTSIMIRPIERYEYLAGRALGCVFFYFIFLAAGALFSYIAALMLNSSLPALFLWGVMQRLTSGIAVLLVVFSIGVLFSSSTAVVVIVVFGIAAPILQHIQGDFLWFIPVLKKWVHYLTLAGWQSDFFDRAVYMEYSKFDLLMNILVVLENLMYGCVAFLACAFVFGKKDLKLRDL